MASRTALALAPPESELCARLVEIGLGTPAMGYGVPVPWPVLLLSPSPVAGVSTILQIFSTLPFVLAATFLLLLVHWFQLPARFCDVQPQ